MSFRMNVLCLFLIGGLVPMESVAIVNGVPDATCECVGSLHDLTANGMVCSGTLIHESWVLTAASCVPMGPDVFAMGFDWGDAPRVYVIDHIVVHPSYGGPAVFDFALMHLSEPVPWEPVCVPMSSGEDTIGVGSTVTHVGYGLTSYPGGFTTQRHLTNNTVDFVDSLGFFTLSSVSGPCIGDAGGPAFRPADDRVAGVISLTDVACAEWAYDGRVSLVFEPWILPTIVNFSGIFFDGFEVGTTDMWSAVSP